MPLIDDNGDVHLAADSRGDGIGALVFSTGGVERHRLKADGTGAGIFGGALPFSVKDTTYGAKGDYTHFRSDGTNITDGAVTNGSTALACATTTPFTSADVGKMISVPGAGAAGVTLNTTIAGFTDSGHVTLAAAASTTVTGKTISYGTDDTAAVQAAINAAQNAGVAFNQGGDVYFPPGRYLVSGLTVTGSGVTLVGCGMGDTASGGFGSMLVGTSTMSSTTDLVTVSGVKCAIEKMALSGGGNGRDVIRLTNAATRFAGDRLYIQSAGTGCGITHGTSVTSVSTKWSNIFVSACGSHGIIVNSSDTEWSNVITFQNGGDGMRVVGTNGTVVNLHPWGNTGAGLTLGGGAGRVTNIYTETNTGNGIDITSIANKVTSGRSWKNTGKGISISGTCDRNELLVDCVDNGGEGVYVQAGSYNKILGGQFFDDQGTKTQTYGVRVAAAAVGTYVGPVTTFDADHITAALLDESTSTTWELGAAKKTVGSDSTFNANTTLADLITIPVKAGTKWLIDGIIYVDGSQLGDFKARLQVSSGTGSSGFFSLDNAAAASSTSTTAISENPAATVAVAASAGSAAVTGTVGVGIIQSIHVSGYVAVSTTDGSLVLQVAQNTSDATVTTVHKESWLRATRVA